MFGMKNQKTMTDNIQTALAVNHYKTNREIISYLNYQRHQRSIKQHNLPLFNK